MAAKSDPGELTAAPGERAQVLLPLDVPSPRLDATSGPPLRGFVAWVELPKTVDAVALYRRAREQRISVAPGPLFSAREKYRHFIRISYARSWDTRAVAALARVGQLAHAMARE